MKKAEEAHNQCQVCGANVYSEHIDSGIARYEDGKLMCKHCLEDYEAKHDASGSATAVEFEPIALESQSHDSAVDMSESRIHGTSAATLGLAGAWDESKFKRKLDSQNPGATRCRTFHAKLTEGALDFMTQQINGWLDDNPHIVVKFASSTIGQFEGKHVDPNLILTVFY